MNLNLSDVSSDRKNSDYFSLDLSMEIQRNTIELIQKIGSGQFGDVYKGVYKPIVSFFVTLKIFRLRNWAFGVFRIAKQLKWELRC